MPTRLCLTPRCGNKATYRGRCGPCATERNRETRSANAPIYNTKRWEMARRRVLFEQPLCECGEIATDIHHKVDLADGGDPWARTNLEALCHSCHSRLTRRTQLAR